MVVVLVPEKIGGIWLLAMAQTSERLLFKTYGYLVGRIHIYFICYFVFIYSKTV